MERPPAEPAICEDAADDARVKACAPKVDAAAPTAAPAPAEPAKRRKKQQTIGPGLVAEAPAPAADEAAPPAAFAFEPVEPLTTLQQRAVSTRLRGAKAEERLALHAKLTADKVPENLVAEQVSALFAKQKAEAEAAVRAEMAEAVAARAIVDAVATKKSRAQPAYPAICEMSDQAIIDELIHVWGYKESTLRTSRNEWRARGSLACWLRHERGEGMAGHPAPATYPTHYGTAPPAQSDPSTADVPNEEAAAPISASATQQSSLPVASGLTERPAAPTPRPPASAARRR